MAARLPLPAELDAALNAAPRFKKSSVVPQTIESKADPHAFERQLLDDVEVGGVDVFVNNAGYTQRELGANTDFGVDVHMLNVNFVH